MTTLVALSTKDALVMGCDSLGTVTRDLVNPYDLIPEYFDPVNEWKLKKDTDGNPILKEFNDIRRKAQQIPFNQMTHVSKMFSLKPFPVGVMSTGISSIGNRTIKSLINEFKGKHAESSPLFQQGFQDYTVKMIAESLLETINKYYKETFKEWASKPYLELMIGGYGRQGPFPSIFRVFVHQDKIEQTFPDENPFGIAFGGQMQEIQRIVFGTDTTNRVKLILRMEEIFERYLGILQKFLKEKEVTVELPSHRNYPELFPFNNWDLDGFDAEWGDFSEQNAIECVNFFVEIMIKSQQFSSRLPMVGGNVHIVLITKEDGFRFISRREYIHEGYATRMDTKAEYDLEGYNRRRKED